MLDASVFAGNWPFLDTAGCTLTAMLAAVESVGAQGAAVSPAEAILHPEPMTGNRRLIQEADTYAGSGEVVLLPVINPALATWYEHVAEVAQTGVGRVRGVKIFPNYHAYSLADPAVDELAEALIAAGLALCVQLRMYDERTHHPMMKVPGVPAGDVAALGARHPGLNILACAPYMRELAELAPAANVHAELSHVESGRTLKNALEAMGPDRLLFGTHVPLIYPEAAVAKLDSPDVDPGVRDRVGAGNFRRLFGGK